MRVMPAGHLLLRDMAKVMGLPEDWPDPAHLKHGPLDHLVARRHLARHEALMLLGQLHQHRARLDYGVGLSPRPVGVDQGRDLLVRIDRGEGGGELIVGTDVNLVQSIVDAELLGHYDGMACSHSPAPCSA